MRREGMQRGEPPCQVEPSAIRRAAGCGEAAHNLQSVLTAEYQTIRGGRASRLEGAGSYGKEWARLREWLKRRSRQEALTSISERGTLSPLNPLGYLGRNDGGKINKILAFLLFIVCQTLGLFHMTNLRKITVASLLLCSIWPTLGWGTTPMCHNCPPLGNGCDGEGPPMHSCILDTNPCSKGVTTITNEFNKREHMRKDLFYASLINKVDEIIQEYPANLSDREYLLAVKNWAAKCAEE